MSEHAAINDTVPVPVALLRELDRVLPWTQPDDWLSDIWTAVTNVVNLVPHGGIGPVENGRGEA